MFRSKTSVFVLMVLASAIIITSCKKESTSNPVLPYTVTTTVTVNFSNSTPFTFFRFKDSTIVSNADSASAKWDFGLRLTTFLVNSNASGPGSAGVIMQDGIFSNLKECPMMGYAYDTTASKLAIKDGSWYDYNPMTHSFIPKAGKVFIFKTAEGKYAKMEILEATYDQFVGPTPQKIKYKIRYAFQPNGSRLF